jgi:hypothetical protein
MRNFPKVLACDFDSTLAELHKKTGEIGYTTKRKITQKPVKKVANYIRKLKYEGWRVIIHTSRSWEDYNCIVEWLKEHKLNRFVDGIICGKFKADLYLDDRNILLENLK